MTTTSAKMISANKTGVIKAAVMKTALLLLAATLFAVNTAGATVKSKKSSGSSVKAADSTQTGCAGGAALFGPYGMLLGGSGKYLSGELTFDGNCNVAGSNITGGTSGQYSTTSVTGTYGLNSDGSYAVTLNFANPASTQTYVIGVSESGLKARGIESDNTLEAIMDLQSQVTSLTGGYSTSSLSGSYNASCSGVGTTDFNALTFDGNGNVSVIDDFDANGKTTLSGTYAVNGDGTYFGSLAGSYNFNGVIENGVNQIAYTYASGGTGVLACTGRRAQAAPVNLSGYYGFVVGGTSHSAAPGEYFSGSLFFNGSGGISATNVYGGINGGFNGSTGTGSYSVNADNSVNITLNLATPAATHTFLVGVTQGGYGATGIQTDGISVSTIDLQAQLQLPGTSYTNASLVGTYAATCGGSEIDLNYVTFDGNGNITAGSDAYDDGSYGDNPYTGFYSVNSDGTYTSGFFGNIYSVYTTGGVLENGSGATDYAFDLAGTGGVVGCIGESSFTPVGSANAAASVILNPNPGAYSTAPSVTLTSTTPGATIYYTTNGVAPTVYSAVYNGTAIPLSATTTIEAIAVAGGVANSPIAAGTYFVGATAATAALPMFTPTPATYTTPQSVTLTDTTPGATIFYTTNNTAPTINSTRYTGAIPVSATTTIEAIAVATGYNNSLVASATYTISNVLPVAAPPTFSPAPGSYASAQAVTLTDSTTGAIIYYTTDGSAPIASATTATYGGTPITASATTTINAIAVAPNSNNSSGVSGTYTITGAVSGSFTLVQHVNNTACSTGATGTTCAITLTQNINAGDLLVFEASMYPASVITATSNSGAFVQCFSCNGFDPTNNLEETSGGWILSASAQASPITITFNAPATGEIEMWEYSVSGGTATFDGANQNETQNNATPTAAPFSASGSADISVQGCRANQFCTGIGTPFLADNTGNYFAWAGLTGSTPFAPPTWNLAGAATSQLTQMQFGFNSAPCFNGTFADFSGSNGAAVTVPQLFSGTHGWQGGYWTVQGNPAGLTFAQSASQPLFKQTGRLCDGGNYSDSSTTGLQYSTATGTTFLQMNGNNGVLASASVSAGVWYYSGVPSTVTSQTDNLAIFAGGGQDYMIFHEFGNGASRLAEVECGTGVSSVNAALTRNTWYWVEVVYNVTGNHTMKLYNNANPPVQIGSTMTCASRGGYQPAYITIGNVNTDASLPAGYSNNFDGLLLSLDGIDPVLPTGFAPRAATPTFSQAPGQYPTGFNLTITDSTPGSTIYYTTNGTTPTIRSTVYSGQIFVDVTSETIQAIATAPNFSASLVAGGTYTIPLPAAATPTFNPPPQTYTTIQSVTLSDTSAGTAIHYTTDGTTPTAASAVYSGPLTVSVTTTVQAIAIGLGFANSAVATGTYTLNLPPAATPTFSVAAGTFTSPQVVTVSDTTPGAILHCTTDGSTPTIASAVCGTVTVGTTTKLQVLAIATGYSASPVASATYTISAPGTFTLVQHVNNPACTTGTSCTITLAQSINAGDLLVFEGSLYPASVMTGTNNGGKFVQCVSCVGFDPLNNLEETSGGWIISAAAQSSSITVTANFAASGAMEMWEYAVSGGTPQFDGANQNENENSAAPVAASFTPSGTNDVVVLGCRANQACNAVTAPFAADNTGNYFAWADLSAPASYNAPSFTLASPAISQITQMEFGFGPTPCANGTFADFNGTSGSVVTVPQLQSGTHGWLGGFWTVNGVAADLTYQTSASQKIFASTGRLCDGRSYTDSSTTGLQYSTNNPQTFVQMNATNGMMTGKSVSAGVWYYSTIPPNVISQTDDLAIFGTGGQDFLLLHEFQNGNSRFGEIECGSGTSVANVALAQNTWYWVEIVYNTSGNHTMKIYNNANPPVQVGVTMTCPSRALYQPAYVTVGNVNSDSSLPPGYLIDYDGLLVSLDGTDPLLPTAGSPVATAAPVVSPAPGTYATVTTVTLTDPTPGAIIYYTTNGTTPTTSSPIYSGPITVSSTTTVNAIAVASGLPGSTVSTATFTVSPPLVNLSGYYNVYGIATSGTAPKSGGLDTSSYAYNSALLGSSQSYAGLNFAFAPANGLNAISSQTVPLPSGTYNRLFLLGTAVYGPIANQTFVVTYTDGSTSTFTQSMSDWGYPQNYSGETTVVSTATRITPDGTTEAGPWYLYGYTFTLTAGKTAASVKLPANRAAVFLAMGLGATPDTTPTFSPAAGTYTTSQTVAISSTIPNSTIYYTTNGTTPTSASAVYTGPITLSANATFEAIAVAPGYTTSAVGSAAYTVNLTAAAAPAFSVTPATYATTQTVALSDSTNNAVIYYTTNGTTPTTSSTQYSAPIIVSATTTINAIAAAYGYTNSPVSTGTYTISQGTLATPTFSPAAGTYIAAQQVTISGPSGATIYYTTNNTTPTAASTKYTGAFSVSASATVQAIAIETGYTSSAVASAAYVIGAIATPTFNPPAGTYTSIQTVTLSDQTPGVIIQFNVNGGTTTTYATPITVSATATVYAEAISGTGINSPLGTAVYTINLPAAATPTFGLAAGTYPSAQSVTLSDATSGATIYYTTNGTTPTTSSTKYTGAIAVSATTTVEAIAVATGYSNSAVAFAVYTINQAAAATPTFNPGAGTYSSAQSVTLSDATSGATIYYTTNGTTPSTSSTKYTGAIAVSATTTLEAIAVATGYNNSAVATAAYTLTAATPTFSVAAGTYTSAVSLTLADTTSGATIYYTTNGTTPTTSSTKYTGAIAISSTTTVEAIAVATGYNNSAVASAAYTIAASTAVSLSSYYNVYGIATSGTAPKSGGLDTDSYAYNSSLIGTSLMFKNITFALGAANALDAVDNATVSLPSGAYNTLYLLGAAVNGAQASQSIVVTYTDGSTSTFTQNFSDWAIPKGYTNETTVLQMANRIIPTGGTQTGTIDVYGYSFTLTSGKTASKVKLPANRNVVFLGVGLASSSGTASASWTMVGQSVDSVAASSDGTAVATNTPTQTVWQYLSGTWGNIAGTANQVAIESANKLFAISSNNNVYSYSAGVWTQIGSAANSIAAAADGTVVVTNNVTQNVWEYVGGTWTSLNETATKVAVASKSSVYAIGSGSVVYHWNGSSWSSLGATATSIAAGSDGTVLIANSSNQVYQYVSGTTWTQIPGTIKTVAVVKSGGYYGIGTDNNVYGYGNY